MDDFAGYFFDSEALLGWFEKNKRSFPWRSIRAPYNVWISEVMLQQTRASVVVPYFEKWLRLFPDVRSLANADLSQVLKAWEGLGYYSRARNLHLAAKEIMVECEGIFPSSYEELKKIRGLGPYTIGAILSFAFGKNEPCVDGNVRRVLSRYYGIEEDILKIKTQKKIWDMARAIVKKAPISEALIELGALVCQKKPYCAVCPLQGSCLAYKLDRQSELPFKGKNIQYTKLIRAVLILEYEGKFLVRKGKKGEIMQDLYELPHVEVPSEPLLPELLDRVYSQYGKDLFFKDKLPVVKQAFTRFRLDLYPFHFSVSSEWNLNGFEWLSKKETQGYAFSSAHRRILKKLSE